MTNEEKQLLFKDLSGRLPYGVKMLHSEELPEWFSKEHGKGNSTFIFTLTYNSLAYTITEFDRIKPYLRPMSSITEEEIDELKELCTMYEPSDSPNMAFEDYGIRVLTHHLLDNSIAFSLNMEVIDWLNAHHFDYRGLISMGLALEAPKDMYKID